MLAIREEELSMVNGGAVFSEAFGESRFNVGDRVISRSEPDYGIGIVVLKCYNEGWIYTVMNGGGIRRYVESDLESPIL